jgi:hypothetical protein
MSKTGIIRFGEPDGPYAAFCNDAPWALRLHEVTWPTVTHYITAQRYPMVSWHEILCCPDRCALNQVASGDNCNERHRWPAVRDDYLMAALRAKFTQHPELETMLMDTGEREIVFMDDSDRYYGIGPDGHGANMLGRLIRKVRSERLKASSLATEIDLEEQMRAIESAVAERPENAQNMTLLAEAYLEAGLLERAAATARRAMMMAVDNEWAWWVLARALMQLSRYQEAVPVLESLRRTDPCDPDYFEALAEVHTCLGQNVKAKVYAARARRLQQDDNYDD